MDEFPKFYEKVRQFGQIEQAVRQYGKKEELKWKKL